MTINLSEYIMGKVKEWASAFYEIDYKLESMRIDLGCLLRSMNRAKEADDTVTYYVLLDKVCKLEITIRARENYNTTLQIS